MRLKELMKKGLWVILVILVSFLMIQGGQASAENIRIEGEPTFHYYIGLSWEILKEIAVILPVWLLSLLGLARSFFGENWFPFAEKIPVRVTKVVLVAATVLLVGVAVAGAVYSAQNEDSYAVQYMMENRFEGWQNVFAWTLFYGILLYVEQWCIHRNCSRQNIRKKQIWVTVTIFLTLLILLELDCVDLWYIPLNRVDDLNDLEDYYLWWFSLYSAVFILPLWFFTARKTVRLFKNNEQWLTLSALIPKKITVLTAFLLLGIMVWQIQQWRSRSAWISFSEVPEYTRAAGMGHLFQAMIWGLTLFYILCLFVKQIRSARRIKHRL